MPIATPGMAQSTTNYEHKAMIFGQNCCWLRHSRSCHLQHLHPMWWHLNDEAKLTTFLCLPDMWIHPGRLTWNLKRMIWKMIFLSKWVICRFHVNLPGCTFGWLVPIFFHSFFVSENRIDPFAANWDVCWANFTLHPDQVIWSDPQQKKCVHPKKSGVKWNERIKKSQGWRYPSNSNFYSQRIHVWYIYLHLPYKSAKCR